jgi:hypothetical protein
MSSPVWDHLRTYIEAGTEPLDLYQLVGARLLDPHHDTLVQRSRDANRFLIGFQNHQNPDCVQRARRLQMQVARASDTFSDARKVCDYEAKICEDLRHQYSANNGTDPARWQALDLQRWLGVTCNVHSARIDFVRQEMINAAAAALPANTEQAVPQHQRQSFRSTAFADAGTTDPPGEVRPGSFRTRDDTARRRRETQEMEKKPIETKEDSPARPPGFQQQPARRARQVNRPSRLANNPSEIMWVIGAAVVTIILVIVIAALVLIPRIANGAGLHVPQPSHLDEAKSLDALLDRRL